MASQTLDNSQPCSIRDICSLGTLSSVPAAYSFKPSLVSNGEDIIEDIELPIIDFSLLTEGKPEQRSLVIEDLRKACEDWGFFMVPREKHEDFTQKLRIQGAGATCDMVSFKGGQFRARLFMERRREEVSCETRNLVVVSHENDVTLLSSLAMSYNSVEVLAFAMSPILDFKLALILSNGIGPYYFALPASITPRIEPIAHDDFSGILLY